MESETEPVPSQMWINRRSRLTALNCWKWWVRFKLRKSVKRGVSGDRFPGFRKMHVWPRDVRRFRSQFRFVTYVASGGPSDASATALRIAHQSENRNPGSQLDINSGKNIQNSKNCFVEVPFLDHAVARHLRALPAVAPLRLAHRGTRTRGAGDVPPSPDSLRE